MAFFVGRDREARRAYGFDEIALVPGAVTVNPDEVDITTPIGPIKLEIPFLASAMDGVVDGVAVLFSILCCAFVLIAITATDLVVQTDDWGAPTEMANPLDDGAVSARFAPVRALSLWYVKTLTDGSRRPSSTSRPAGRGRRRAWDFGARGERRRRGFQVTGFACVARQ